MIDIGGVAELVDAQDLKFCGLNAREGSIPSSPIWGQKTNIEKKC